MIKDGCDKPLSVRLILGLVYYITDYVYWKVRYNSCVGINIPVLVPVPRSHNANTLNVSTDNGREFVNSIITETAEMWPGLQLVHGRPRHSQSQVSGIKETCVDISSWKIKLLFYHGITYKLFPS